MRAAIASPCGSSSASTATNAADVRKATERLGRELTRELFPAKQLKSNEERRQRRRLELTLTRIILLQLRAGLPQK